jgi:DNA-binding Lrp family transcriptional regulator
VTATRSVTSDDIRVIICIMFDRRAAPAEIGAFKDTVFKCPSVLHAVEVSGTFDFIVEATIPDMEAYTAQLELCAQTVARLIARYEVSFVCKRFVSADETRRAVWVPCDEGMVRIDCAKIDKVTAEGDYMRIHSAGQSWMMHSTMAALSDCLDDSFVRLHRSILVRRDFISSMTHGQSHWTAQLNDGTRERVAKVHVRALLDSLRVSPSNRKATSSMIHSRERLSAVG